MLQDNKERWERGWASVYLKFSIFGSILEKVFNRARFPNSHDNLVSMDMLDCLFARQKKTILQLIFFNIIIIIIVIIISLDYNS